MFPCSLLGEVELVIDAPLMGTLGLVQTQIKEIVPFPKGIKALFSIQL